MDPPALGARTRHALTTGVRADNVVGAARGPTVTLPDGKRITIGANEIVEPCIPDASSAARDYILSFAGVVTCHREHPAYPVVSAIDEDRVSYDLEFVRPDGARATEDQDFEMPRSPARVRRAVLQALTADRRRCSGPPAVSSRPSAPRRASSQ